MVVAAKPPLNATRMVAGDIAGDPSDPHYNGGEGTGTFCMQLATSNELTNAVETPAGRAGDQGSSLSLRETTCRAWPWTARCSRAACPSQTSIPHLRDGQTEQTLVQVG
jgi:hypothetical protein